MQVTLVEVREFVHSRLANIRRLLYADVERARMELARHVSRIKMRPIVSDGEGYYVAGGEWNFLGTGLEMDRAPHLGGGGARLVAGVGFEPTFGPAPLAARRGCQPDPSRAQGKRPSGSRAQHAVPLLRKGEGLPDALRREAHGCGGWI